MRLMRRAVAAASLAMLAACVAPPAGHIAPAAVAPAPVMRAPVPSRPAVLGSFAFDGSFMQGGLVRGTAPDGVVALALDEKAVPLDAGRRFVIGFDRDAGPAAVLDATLASGRHAARPLAIAPRAWRLERLGGLPKLPVPSADFTRRRPDELAQIRAARATATDAAGWRQAMSWPATGRLSGLFGAQRIYANGEKGAYHSGADVAVPTGTVIRAPADGVVVLAADHPFTLEGNLLIVDHGDGLNSAFLHLSRIDVRVGDHVRQGQPIALSGATGRATGPHLHWSLSWRDARLDPLLAAGPMPGR